LLATAIVKLATLLLVLAKLLLVLANPTVRTVTLAIVLDNRALVLATLLLVLDKSDTILPTVELSNKSLMYWPDPTKASATTLPGAVKLPVLSNINSLLPSAPLAISVMLEAPAVLANKVILLVLTTGPGIRSCPVLPNCQFDPTLPLLVETTILLLAVAVLIVVSLNVMLPVAAAIELDTLAKLTSSSSNGSAPVALAKIKGTVIGSFRLGISYIYALELVHGMATSTVLIQLIVLLFVFFHTT
jgi:hypothetical protein